jgi:hypothetical protein
VSPCTGCGRGVVHPPKRKYCDNCSRQASAAWKRKHRHLFSIRWRHDPAGPPPWMDGWRTPEERRAYYRDYMRKWRKRVAPADPVIVERVAS